MSTTMQNIFSSANAGTSPNEGKTNTADLMRQLLRFQAMHGTGVRRDPNGLPIDTEAPQGLDALLQSQVNAPDRQLQRLKAESALRDLMQKKYNYELQMRDAAGRDAVALEKRKQAENSVFDGPNVTKSNARGERVAYRNGMPVGFSGFDTPSVIGDGAERSMVNRKGLMLKDERQALQDNIMKTASVFDPEVGYSVPQSNGMPSSVLNPVTDTMPTSVTKKQTETPLGQKPDSLMFVPQLEAPANIPISVSQKVPPRDKDRFKPVSSYKQRSVMPYGDLKALLSDLYEDFLRGIPLHRSF